MLIMSLRFISYYKFIKKLPYVDLKNTYIYFLTLSSYLKKLVLKEKTLLRLRTFVYSYRKGVITIFKTPMAHKNWSKEQLFIKENLFIVSVKGVHFIKKLKIQIVFKILTKTVGLMRQQETAVMYIKNLLISYKFTYKLK